MARGWVLAAAGIVGVLAAIGCGDDDDEAAGNGDGKPMLRDGGTRFDAGMIDAGMSLRELGLDAGVLVSDLDLEQSQQFCQELDHVGGLLGDVKKACAVEAYLFTYDEQDCTEILKQCKQNGQTVLGLELALRCSSKPTELTGCDAPVDDVITCAATLGVFWAARTCTSDALFDPGPGCSSELASSCPLLFGPPSD